MPKDQPPIRVTFKYNIDTGDIEEFIIDDNAASASEDYHNKVADLIALRLGRNPEIKDAGPIRHQKNISEPVKSKTGSTDNTKVTNTG